MTLTGAGIEEGIPSLMPAAVNLQF